MTLIAASAMLCILPYVYDGPIFHEPPCRTTDIGYAFPVTKDFYFAENVTPKQRDFLAGKLANALPGVHIHAEGAKP